MDGDGSSRSVPEEGEALPTERARTEKPAALTAPDRHDDARHDEDEIEDGPGDSIFSRLFGFLKPSNSDDLTDALNKTEREAVERLPRARREMIERVIAFNEKRVEDVMAPRADIVAVDIETPLDELVKAFAEAGHSRLPIYRHDLDDPQGMVHLKDVIGLIANPDAAKSINGPILKTIRREALYVPPSMRVTDLLLKMQASRIHMALVIDEYGGTDGLLTIEDLVEEIVGDINDEHDDEEAPTIRPHPNGGWEADASVELAEFSEMTGVELMSDDEEIDTLGGLVVSLAGRVPQRGEVLQHDSGLDFEVTEADPRKVRKIRIRWRPAAETPSIETPI